MTHDERIAAWKEAIKDRAALAEERFARDGVVTLEDTVAVALAHPEAYEVSVRLKGRIR